MVFEPNALFYWMLKMYSENSHHKKQIRICNEGGARSSKTWDTIHLIVAFCDQHKYKDIPLKIAFFRNTLKDCRDKLYEEDFKLCLKMIGIYDKSNARKENQSPEYDLWGNDIFFRGLDEATEQPTYDIVFINEALEVNSYVKVAGLFFRCRKLVIMDWNPKFTAHWCFDLEGQPLTFFSKTTYLNNPKLAPEIVENIQRYSPWNLEDLCLPETKRRPHEQNIANKTANRFYFLVYGMGMRGAMEGLIFEDVKWIDQLPDQFDKEFYGLDFGFTSDPSAFVKCRFKKNSDKNQKSDLFLELKLYEPTKDSEVLQSRLLLVEPNCKNFSIHADSAAPLMIGDLRRSQFQIFACPKPAGSIVYGIDLLLRFNINIVNNLNAKKEQENYMWRIIQGIKVNEPIDAHNHMWDAVRYAAFMELRQYATY